jgi:hypothetical protein
MHLNDISSEVSLGIVKMIIIAVLGTVFVGQFTVHNEREYITLQSTVTKEIYHDLRWEAGNINRVIEWIYTEAYNSRMSGE